MLPNPDACHPAASSAAVVSMSRRLFAAILSAHHSVFDASQDRVRVLLADAVGVDDLAGRGEGGRRARRLLGSASTLRRGGYRPGATARRAMTVTHASVAPRLSGAGSSRDRDGRQSPTAGGRRAAGRTWARRRARAALGPVGVVPVQRRRPAGACGGRPSEGADSSGLHRLRLPVRDRAWSERMPVRGSLGRRCPGSGVAIRRVEHGPPGPAPTAVDRRRLPH